ncbi:unnamed protein product [Caenorhabditis auriculariae]|uniref:BZIP domain-containing protein n=1 Tax=Caenorhabditis auriculariae TaxID=2777116 RepID=A0A8S1HJN5_9PELO|nr:unnamed protein product [Caenorhabditis auriculariae]
MAATSSSRLEDIVDRIHSIHKHQWMSMDEQERKKLERKRARNRQAASKCRQKKMERISELEQQVTNEKQRAARLDIELDQLQRALNDMQSLIASHSNRGCQSPHSQHRH